MMDGEKLLPQNVEAEAAVLGCILMGDDAIGKIASTLRPEDFYRAEHRTIYAAALDLHSRGVTSDLITLPDELERLGTLEEVGGRSDISALTNQVPTAENIGHYAAIVARTAYNRRVIAATGQLAALALADPDPDVLLTTMRELLSEEIAPRASGGFRFMSDEECERIEPARGVVGNILAEDSIAFLYAREGRWKTFLAIDWALSCATGRAWLGRSTVAGDTVYIASEGARNIGKRVRAWKNHHGVEKAPRIHLLGEPVQLMDAGQVRQLIGDIRARCATPPVLVVIDTLARSMAGGNENDTRDINAVTDAAYAIKAAFSCCVLIIHHSGKEDTRGMRGSSALRSNADAVLRIVGNDDTEAKIQPGEPITLKCEKSKDGEAFEDITLTTTLEKWGTEASQILSSLVIVQGTPAQKVDSPLTDKQQAALDALYRAQDGMKATAWLKDVAMPDRTFYEARDSLVKRGYATKGASTALYSVTVAGTERVTAAVRDECARSAPAVAADEEVTAAAVEDCEDGNPQFNGTAGTAGTAVPIGASQFRSKSDPHPQRPCYSCRQVAWAVRDGKAYCTNCQPMSAEVGA